MIVIRADRLVPPAGTGPQVNSRPYYFDRAINACWVGLAGYQLSYVGDDHHVQTASVQLTAAVRDTEFGRGVVVEAVVLLRDDNGDDKFAGWVDYVLFVDLGDIIRNPDVRPPLVATQ